MDQEETPPDHSKPQRISVSLDTLREEIKNGVETALLRLQLDLVKTYATLEDSRKTEHRLDGIETKLDALEQDKAGREAVTNFKRWLTGGAILATVFMAIQVAISLWLVTRGQHR